MLSELAIENFAIIDRLLVRFDQGLTVITGETGAGKSIIIDALQAALGARVPAEAIRDQSERAVIEAVFHLNTSRPDETLLELLDANGIETGDTVILRREIHVSGRSTSRINGRAVPIGVLGSVGALMVDIHGQSDHLSVLRRDRQLEVLDRYGGLLDLRGQTGESIRDYVRLRHELDALATGRRAAEQRLDLLRFQVQEIESAGLRPGEDNDLLGERSRLMNAEKLTTLADRAYQELRAQTQSALDRVQVATDSLRDLVAIDSTVAELHERLQSAQFEMEDIAQETRSYRDSVESDPVRLEAVEQRLDTLSRLLRKFGTSVEDVLAFGAEARKEMEDVENFDERLLALEERVDEAEKRAAGLAETLSRERQSGANRLTLVMRDALTGLALTSADFQVRLSRQLRQDGVCFSDGQRYSLGTTGADSIEFLVSFNPGEPLRPLEKVASGGETSRFLLALKSVLAEADQTATLVFDEVDVGVGGRNGAVVGDRLRSLAHSHQVISITHLPQVAAMSDHHISVSKAFSGERTTVAVQGLDHDQRVREIAEMMSGMGTDTALRNAEELLHAGQRA